MERRDVIRTRNSIKEAYLSLSLRMPFNKITVTAIIDELQISRATFYAHFQDIIELRENAEYIRGFTDNGKDDGFFQRYKYVMKD